MPSDDIAQFLANSPDRLTLLTRLSQESSSPGELASQLPVSRRSVQRNLAEFVNRGWAETTGGTYHLTVTGTLVAEEHAAYLESLTQISDFALFFRHLPDRDHAPDPAWLDEATLTVATSDDPHAPIHQYVTSVRQFNTDRIQMLSPVLSRLFHEAHATLAARGARTELIMPAAMIEQARERNPIEFNAITSLDILSLYRCPNTFSIGITLGEEPLLMAAYDEQKQLRALVEATDPQFYAWAAELFDRYQKQSEQV